MGVFFVDSWEDMTDAIAEGNVEVIDVIFKVVKRGVSKKYKKVKMFSIVLADDPEYQHDWYLERSEYQTALENCMEVYIHLERYEDCAEIKKLLDYLSIGK